MIFLAASSSEHWDFIIQAYGIFALVFILLITVPILRRKKLKSELRSYYHRKKLLSGNDSK